ncbi:hypothetical protein VTK56DRAFT_1889 [Thermocarpiscus australiensis]
MRSNPLEKTTYRETISGLCVERDRGKNTAYYKPGLGCGTWYQGGTPYACNDPTSSPDLLLGRTEISQFVRLLPVKRPGLVSSGLVSLFSLAGTCSYIKTPLVTEVAIPPSRFFPDLATARLTLSLDLPSDLFVESNSTKNKLTRSLLTTQHLCWVLISTLVTHPPFRLASPHSDQTAYTCSPTSRTRIS